MLRTIALLVAATLSVGCDGAAPRAAYSVRDVIRDISSNDSKLDGKRIAIRGWLGDCGGLDCGLYQTLEDARTVQRGDHGSDEWMGAMDRRLAVGGGGAFDLLAGMMQFEEVVIYGQVNAKWHAPPSEVGTSFMCMDRCDDIIPHSIEKVLF